MNKSINDFLPDASAPIDITIEDGMQYAADYMLVNLADVKKMLRPRKPFSNKGTYGHALIIAGAEQTMGAALLASKGCLYGGAGLTTAAIPKNGLSALNSALPEVMFIEKAALLHPDTLNKYNVIAIGPGIGSFGDSLEILDELIASKRSIIADADALNIMSYNKNWLRNLGEGSVLTPHVKEFDRLFGDHKNWWERLQTAKSQAKKNNIVIVLKNQYTFIIDQKGLVHINPTGNPAMAQGGMGDILTGLIAAYVAQGYSPKESAILACYVHGKSGDELSKKQFNLTASQVAEHVPFIVKELI